MECWPKLQLLHGPSCARCHAPIEFQLEDSILCAECLTNPPHYHKAFAVVAYNDTSQPLVTRLKYADHGHLAPVLAQWMMQHGEDFVQQCDVIVPVPMHWRRLVSRKFNQAALLARQLAKVSNVAVCYDALKRIKNNPPQASLTKAQRSKNMRGTFAVNPKYAAQIQHKRVLLVDDVITTGATMNACAKSLLRAGAAEVYVIAFAKTL